MRDPVWLQSTYDVLVDLFKRVSLKSNAKNMQGMKRDPGKIRESCSTAFSTKEVDHKGLTLSTD